MNNLFVKSLLHYFSFPKGISCFGVYGRSIKKKKESLKCVVLSARTPQKATCG